jgi:hypothetical protein
LNNADSYNLYRDNLILFGVILQKAQAFFWQEFVIDIRRTVASLALAIFRMNYYDDEKHPMFIPKKNLDISIQRAYYGGHSNVYLPEGDNLYAYNVNSLYPHP